MAVNRYTGFEPTQYQSTYIPLPFQELAAIGEVKQKQHDDALAGIDLTKQKLLLQGGYRTQDRANIYNQKITENLNKLSEQIVKGTTNPNQIKSQIANFANIIVSDPEYQSVKKDEQYKENVDKLFQSQDIDRRLFRKNWFDPKSGEIQQTQPGEQFNPGWYGTTVPVAFKPDHKDLYEEIKAQTKLDYNAPESEIQTTEDGRQFLVNTQTGEKTTEITRDYVANLLAPFAQDPENYMTRGSVAYKSALRENQGQEYSPDDYLNDLVNNYFGYFSDKQEIQKQTTKPLSTKGTGAGSGIKGPDYVPNKYLQMVDPKSTTLTQESLKGLFIEGDKKGTYKVSVDAGKTPIDFAQVGNVDPKQYEDFLIVSLYKEKEGNFNQKIKDYNSSEFKASFNRETKKLQEKYPGLLTIADFKITNADDFIDILNRHTQEGNLSEEDVIKKFNIKHNGKLVQSTISFLKDIQDPSKDTELINFKKELNNEYGVDVDKTPVSKQYDKLTQKYGEEGKVLLGNMMMIGGDVDFMIDPGKENKFNVSDKLFIKGKAVFSKSELDARFAQINVQEAGDWGPNDWQDLFIDDDAPYKGLIKSAGVKYNEKSGEYEELYEIPINKEVQISRDMQDQYNKAYYGETTSGKNKAAWDYEYDEYFIDQLRNKSIEVQQQKISAEMKKIAPNIQVEGDKIFLSILKLSKDKRDILTELFVKDILLTTDRTQQLDRLAKIKTALNDPATMEELMQLYKQPTSTQGGGAGGKFKQTPKGPSPLE